MSQLELALKRARELDAAAQGKVPERVSAESRVSTWAFKSAWDFDGASENEPVPVPPQTAVSARPDRRGQLPRFRAFAPEVREKLVVGERARPEIREQFRKLAATLYSLQKDRERRIVMIVSAVPGEGKTLTATNFALTLSESYGARVLLVDADLRRPSVHKIFDVPNEVGLKEALTSDGDSRFSTVRISPRLEVLTAGSASVDPMNALTSDLLRLRLGAAARAFDWVVLDTPPVELLPDAKILAGLADAAILVVEAGVTKSELAQRAIEVIGRESIIGVVLNRLPDSGRHVKYREYHYEQHPAAIERS